MPLCFCLLSRIARCLRFGQVVKASTTNPARKPNPTFSFLKNTPNFFFPTLVPFINFQRIGSKHELTSSSWQRRPRLSRLGVLKRRCWFVRIFFGPALVQLSADSEHWGSVHNPEHQPQEEHECNNNQWIGRQLGRAASKNINTNTYTHTYTN